MQNPLGMAVLRRDGENEMEFVIKGIVQVKDLEQIFYRYHPQPFPLLTMKQQQINEELDMEISQVMNRLYDYRETFVQGSQDKRVQIIDQILDECWECINHKQWTRLKKWIRQELNFLL